MNVVPEQGMFSQLQMDYCIEVLIIIWAREIIAYTRNTLTQSINTVTGKMAQWLKEPVALSRDQYFIPITNIVVQTLC